MNLSRRIQEYYHKKGYTKVKVWVETDLLPNGRHFHSVRSNVKFSLANL